MSEPTIEEIENDYKQVDYGPEVTSTIPLKRKHYIWLIQRVRTLEGELAKVNAILREQEEVVLSSGESFTCHEGVKHSFRKMFETCFYCKLETLEADLTKERERVKVAITLIGAAQYGEWTPKDDDAYKKLIEEG